MESLVPIRWHVGHDVAVLFIEAETQISSIHQDEFFTMIRERHIRRMLSCSIGRVVVDGAMRRRSAALLREHDLQVASLVGDRASRALVKALNWLGVQMRAFDWDEIDDALAALELGPELAQFAKHAALTLREESLRRWPSAVSR